jgi:hypothetical protein
LMPGGSPRDHRPRWTTSRPGRTRERLIACDPLFTLT